MREQERKRFACECVKQNQNLLHKYFIKSYWKEMQEEK